VRFGTDPSAPLPLAYNQAIARAAVLRNTDPVAFTYPTITEVMRIYHGFERSPWWWQKQLRGRVAASPRGVPIDERLAA
jgi:hypothetical protein